MMVDVYMDVWHTNTDSSFNSDAHDIGIIGALRSIDEHINSSIHAYLFDRIMEFLRERRRV